MSAAAGGRARVPQAQRLRGQGSLQGSHTDVVGSGMPTSEAAGQEGATVQRTMFQVVKHEVTSRDGMVVAQHPLIAEAGAEMLHDGGNAMDAAVTAAFSAGVAEPFMSGIGGG